MKHLAIRILLLCVLSPFPVLAQTDPVDSLKQLLGSQLHDTTRLQVLLGLVENIYDDNVWPAYNEQAFELAEELADNTDKKIREAGLSGKATALNNKGYLLNIQGQLAEALVLYQQSLELRRSLADTAAMAESYNNIAQIYDHQGRIREALQFYQICLSLLEKSQDLTGLAGCLNNLGALLYNQGELDESMAYYERSKSVYEKIHDDFGLSRAYNNIGLIHKDRRRFEKALECYNQSLALKEKMRDKIGQASTLNNIGGILLAQGRSDEALDYYQRSRKIREEEKDFNSLPFSLNNIANIYLLRAAKASGSERQRWLSEAAKLASEALEISKKYGNLDNLVKSELYLSKTDSALGKMGSALEHYKQYIAYRDSMKNDQTRKAALRQQMQYEFGLKEADTKARHDREIAIAETEKKQQRFILFAVIMGLLLAVGFGFQIYRSLKITSHQKKIIEEKNKDITDSINYAKRIQDAQLPPREIKYRLFPDAFVLFLPKDVVSGDFYWFAEKDGKRLIAAVDCTGHGVPGAFMSLIGNTFLNEIVDQQGITRPDLILHELRQMVVKSLKQADGESKDGMDIALLCFDDKERKVEFAGANNPLWLFREGHFTEFRPDKQPIGYFPGEAKPFTLHSIPYDHGDRFFIFSDGFADQFGGPKGKKFKYRQIQETMLALGSIPMLEQEKKLLQAFENWKGSLEQVDDVLVIGVRT